MVYCVHSVSQQKRDGKKAVNIWVQRQNPLAELQSCNKYSRISVCFFHENTIWVSCRVFFFADFTWLASFYILSQCCAVLCCVAFEFGSSFPKWENQNHTFDLFGLVCFGVVWQPHHWTTRKNIEAALELMVLVPTHFFPHIQDISNRHRRRCRLVLSFRIEKLTYFIYLNRNGGCKYFIAELQTMYSSKVRWLQTFKFYSQTIWILLDFFLLSLTQLKINGNGYGGGVCHVIQTFTLKLNFPIFFFFPSLMHIMPHKYMGVYTRMNIWKSVRNDSIVFGLDLNEPNTIRTYIHTSY